MVDGAARDGGKLTAGWKDGDKHKTKELTKEEFAGRRRRSAPSFCDMQPHRVPRRAAHLGANTPRTMRHAPCFVRFVRPVFLAILAVGCAAPYVPGSILGSDGEFSNTRRAGCIDIAAGTKASHEVGSDGVLVWVELGNRCDRAVPIDITRLRVAAHGDNHVSFPLAAFNPRAEIHPAQVAAHASGVERIEFYYVPADATRVCIDWSEMVEEERTRGPVPDPSRICVSR